MTDCLRDQREGSVCKHFFYCLLFVCFCHMMSLFQNGLIFSHSNYKWVKKYEDIDLRRPQQIGKSESACSHSYTFDNRPFHLTLAITVLAGEGRLPGQWHCKRCRLWIHQGLQTGKQHEHVDEKREMIVRQWDWDRSWEQVPPSAFLLGLLSEYMLIWSTLPKETFRVFQFEVKVMMFLVGIDTLYTTGNMVSH